MQVPAHLYLPLFHPLLVRVHQPLSLHLRVQAQVFLLHLVLRVLKVLVLLSPLLLVNHLRLQVVLAHLNQLLPVLRQVTAHLSPLPLLLVHLHH